MSLPNKVSSVVFVIDPTGIATTHTITVQDLSIPTSLRFWDGRKGLSITGKKRRRNIIRGFDRNLTFKWNDVRTQESTILSLIDDLKTATDNDYRIRFNVSGGTDYIYVIPEDAVYNQDYINQIRRTPTTVTFTEEAIRSNTGYD